MSFIHVLSLSSLTNKLGTWWMISTHSIKKNLLWNNWLYFIYSRFQYKDWRLHIKKNWLAFALHRPIHMIKSLTSTVHIEWPTHCWYVHWNYMNSKYIVTVNENEIQFWSTKLHGASCGIKYCLQWGKPHFPILSLVVVLCLLLLIFDGMVIRKWHFLNLSWQKLSSISYGIVFYT